jgi:alpha-glucosidase
MRWDETHCAGFTTAEPWLPVGSDFQNNNVARLQKDTCSILWLYRRLIQLRRTESALMVGDHIPVRSRDGLLMHKRTWQGQEILVALNLVSEPRRFEWNAAGRLLLSTYLDKSDVEIKSPVVLRPDEGVIIKLSNP